MMLSVAMLIVIMLGAILLCVVAPIFIQTIFMKSSNESYWVKIGPHEEKNFNIIFVAVIILSIKFKFLINTGACTIKLFTAVIVAVS
jgi:hypothetical protein